jgi:hypothetical protein
MSVLNEVEENEISFDPVTASEVLVPDLKVTFPNIAANPNGVMEEMPLCVWSANDNPVETPVVFVDEIEDGVDVLTFETFELVKFKVPFVAV